MKTNWFKRTLCSILALVLVLGYVPVQTIAAESDGLCEHHTQHTEACGYSAAVEGHACNHEHTDECYQSVVECVHAHGDCGYVPAVEGHDCDCQPDENGEIVHTEGCGYVEAVEEVPCGHVCSEETGCVTKALNCQHQHDSACGYAEAAAETPCGFVCEECAKKEALKNGLQEIPVESVTITQEEELSEVLVGETLELTAVVLPENATNKTVSWSSSNEAIATVDENGVVTGVTEGEATITASSGDMVGNYTLTVKMAEEPAPVNAESVSITQAEGLTEVPIGGMLALTAVVLPENATDKTVTWSSSDEAIATVDENGVVTAVAEGEVTITVSAGDAVGNYTLTVKVAEEPVPVNAESVSIAQAEGLTEVPIGGTLALTAIVLPENATDKTVVWSSSDESIATVDENGVVTGVAEGSVQICVRLWRNREREQPDADIALHAVISPQTSASGSCGTSAEWTLSEDGVLTIFGEGVIDDYTQSLPAPWFESSGSIREVVVEAGITRIGNMAFSELEHLNTVTLADTVTCIGSLSFFRCTALETIKMPTTLESIEDGAFNSCSSLAGIIISKTVVSIGDNAFSDCSKLSTVVFENERITPFTLGAFVFYQCKAITDMTLPEGLEGLGNGCFDSCANLSSLQLPISLNSFGKDIFYGCKRLVLKVAEKSDALIFAVQKSLKYEIYEEENTNDYLLANSCGISVDTQHTQYTGEVRITLNYCVADAAWAQITKPSLRIYLSDNLSLNRNSVVLGNETCVDYQYFNDSNCIELGIQEPSGSASFNAELDDNCSILCIGYFNCLDGIPKRQKVGYAEASAGFLTVSAPSSTSQSTVCVTGLAPASSTVEFFLNGESCTTAMADENGIYRTEITLSAAAENTAFLLKATCSTGEGTLLTAQTSVCYKPSSATIKEIRFYDNCESDEYVVINGSDKAVDINHTSSQNPYKFEIEISDATNIGHVFVTSTVNNVKKSIPAVYDNTIGRYIATGYFDENDKYYKPGAISVEYTLIGAVPPVGETVDWEALDSYLGLENASVSKTEDYGLYSGIVDLSKSANTLSNIAIEYLITDYAELEGSDQYHEIVSGLNGVRKKYQNAKDMLAYVVPGLDDSRYFLYLDYSDPSTLKMLVDDGLDVGSKAIEVVLRGTDKTSEQYRSLAALSENIANATDIGDVVFELYNIEADMLKIKNDILMSTTVEDKAAALKDVDALEKDRQMFTVLSTVLALAVPGAGASQLLFSAMLGAVGNAASDVFDHRVSGIVGESVETNWYPNVEINEEMIGDALFYRDVQTWHTEYDNSVPGTVYSRQLVDSVDLYIYGVGPMWNDASVSHSCSMEHASSCVTNLHILPGITSIADYAFSHFSGIDLVEIPDTVVHIGAGAFKQCSARRVVIPGSVRTVGERAFENCKNLETVSLQNGLQALGDYMFWGCNLKSVSLPRSLKTVGRTVFGNTEITELVIPAELEDCIFDCWGFLNSSNVTTVGFEDGMTKIPDYVLSWTDSVDTVFLPETVTEIGSCAFEQCMNLTQVTLPQNLQTIGNRVFFNCKGLTEIHLPSSIKEIGVSAFAWTGLDSIEFPESIRTIEDGAFFGTSIQNITLPSSVETVFYRSGSGVLYSVFDGMENLQNIYVDEKNALYASRDGVLFDKDEKILLLYPIGRTSSYSVPIGTTTIAEDAFDKCTVSGNLIIPNTVTSVMRSAFAYLNSQDGNSCAQIRFSGNAPTFDYFSFHEANVEIWYPKGYTGWEEARSAILDGHSMVWKEYMADDVQTEEYWIDTPVTLTEDTVVPEGTTVYIDNGGSVTVPAGIKLDIQGSVTIYDGSLTVEKGGSLTVCDNLKALSVWTGKLDVTGADISGVPCGSVEVQLNSSAEVIGIPDNMLYASIYVYDTADINTSLKLSDRYAWLDLISDTSITLGNNIDIPENTEFVLWNSDPDSKTVQFVIPKGIRLANYGCFSVYDGCRVVAEPGSMLFNFNYIYVSPFSTMLALGVFSQDGVVEGEILQKTGSQDNLEALLADCAQNNYGWIQENEVRLVRDLTIDLGEKSFEISKYGSIIVSNGVTLTVNSAIDLYCSDSQEGGTIIVENGGRLIINGTLTTEYDSKLTLKSGAYMQVNGSVFNNGGITLEKGSTLQLSGSWIGLSPRNNGGTILPHADSIQIQEQGGMIDLHSTDRILLHIQSSPDTAMKGVKWSSSNIKIVDPTKIIDNGMGEYCITFGKALGSVTLTATAIDGSKKTDSITLNVIYLDSAKALTAVSDTPSMGLQPGQKAQISVSGMNPIALENLDFTIPSTQNSIATVDDSGVITAGTKPGTVTVTVVLKGDPLKRKVSVRIPVIAMQAEELSVAVDGAVKPELRLDKDSALRTFTLTAPGKNYLNDDFTPNVTWVSMDPAVARVTVARDGTVTLTIPANASGECFVTATSKDLAKITARLKVTVRDYAPRLNSTKLTLNSNLAAGTSVSLLESYENLIRGVTLHEYNRAIKGYQEEPSTRFLPEYDSESATLTIRTLSPVANNTYSLQLKVATDYGEYTYNLQVKVANALPSVTVKQSSKFNLFYLDSTAALSITAPGQTITDVQLTGNTNFEITTGYTDGVITIGYSDAFQASPAAKPNTKMKVAVYLQGYTVPVYKDVTLSTVNARPKLSLSATSCTINTMWGDGPEATVQVLKNGEPMDLTNAEVTCTAKRITCAKNGTYLTLTLAQDPDGRWVRDSVLIRIRESGSDGWNDSISLTYTMNVNSTLPAVKLGKGTLKLNNKFPDILDATTVALTQQNLAVGIAKMEIVPAYKKTQSAYQQAEKLQLNYDPETCEIHAQIVGDNMPNPGTYSFKCTGILGNEDSTRISPVTLKVQVINTMPTMKLAATTLKLNRFFTARTDKADVSLTLPSDTLAGVTFVSKAKVGTTTRTEAEKIVLSYNAEKKQINAKFLDPNNAPKAGTYAFTYTGTLTDGRPIAGGTLNVVVQTTVPVVRLSATSVKLNSYLAGAECVQITPTVGAGYTIIGFTETSDWVEYNTASGKLDVKLTPGAVNGKYTIKLTPILRDAATGQEVNHPTQLSLTVQVYNSEKLGVSLSARGKLDTLNPDSTIVYTPKLTNCIGEITDVSLAGQDAGKFLARLEDGKIVLALRDGQDYATNVTYKVQFRVSVCGKEILSPVMNVKVTQSAVKRTVTPGSLTLYQAQRMPLTLRLTQSMGEIDDISISTKTSSELIKALGEDGINATIEGNTAGLKLTVENAALLKAGKSYTLYLDVTPKNNATNLNPAQVKLTVRVMK